MNNNDNAESWARALRAAGALLLFISMGNGITLIPMAFLPFLLGIQFSGALTILGFDILYMLLGDVSSKVWPLIWWSTRTLILGIGICTAVLIIHHFGESIPYDQRLPELLSRVVMGVTLLISMGMHVATYQKVRR